MMKYERKRNKEIEERKTRGAKRVDKEGRQVWMADGDEGGGGGE